MRSSDWSSDVCSSDPSAGKAALGNALLGREAFTVGVLHGTTTDADHAMLDEAQHDGLVLIDTPGINELDGEAREKLAFEVAEVSDLEIGSAACRERGGQSV